MSATNERLETLREETHNAFPQRYEESLPHWLRAARREGYLCQQDVDDLLAYFANEVASEPVPADEAEEASFALRNEAPKRKVWRADNDPTRQRVLFAGLDCLPGQGDLFDC